MPYQTSFVYRYVEKTIHQAIVQKVARIVSTLSAAHLLMHHGFVQEQACLQRILQELNEDVYFLSIATINNDVTALHKSYLEAFYEEEFDANTPLESTQKRIMIPRQKIQAYLASVGGSGLDRSTGNNLLKTLSKTYSGFVHGASPQIMEMYGGDPPKFHVYGLLGTSRYQEHRDDLWNYFYRSILAFGFAAKAFGDQRLFDQISAFLYKFEKN
ncbi:MAG: hypothetical protein HY254_18215 [Burkholderiales bacterium]|nr:hypothetical protein [Burkholderiales bacterium]